MQSYKDVEGNEAREFFMGESKREIMEAMDERRAELRKAGASDFSRAKIGRNSTCPCGSKLKFKKCCMAGARVISTR